MVIALYSACVIAFRSDFKLNEVIPFEYRDDNFVKKLYNFLNLLMQFTDGVAVCLNLKPRMLLNA